VRGAVRCSHGALMAGQAVGDARRNKGRSAAVRRYRAARLQQQARRMLSGSSKLT